MPLHVPVGRGEHRVFHLVDGLFQGECFSPAHFCLVLALGSERFLELARTAGIHDQAVKIFAYIDDTTLACPTPLATTVWPICVEPLQEYGFRVVRAKSDLWGPNLSRVSQ